MDLPTVKAAVKAWEKGYRSREGRAPGKDDIKKDPSGIAEQYALYRKLSKLAGPSQPPSSTSTSNSHSHSHSRPSSTAGPSTTPRTIPNNEYPTTPTPPTRRSSSFLNVASGSSSNGSSSTIQIQLNLNGTRGEKRNGHASGNGSHEVEEQSLKRKASTTALLTSPTTKLANRSFITPKKPRPSYSGPVIDPNPVNPFAITPPRPSPSRSPFITSLGGGGGPSTSAGGSSTAIASVSSSTTLGPSQSPFLHASSPRKLRELLSSNSLRKVRERNGGPSEITPRTKARKRLAGEIADTPVRDKPRRRRGEGREGGEGGEGSHGSGEGDVGSRMIVEEEEEEEEDEFGPSPMKVPGGSGGVTRTFTELLTVEREEVTVKVQRQGATNGHASKLGQGKEKAKRGRPSEMLGLFGRTAGGTPRDKVNATSANGGHPGIKAGNTRGGASQQSQLEENSLPVTSTTQRVAVRADTELVGRSPEVDEPQVYEPAEAEALSTPPPDDILDQSTPSQTRNVPRQPKILSFSDDEEDEWDPEGGNVRRQVLITGTRRAAIRRGSSDDLDEHTEEEEEEGEGKGGDSLAIEEEEGVGEGDGIEDEDGQGPPTLGEAEGTTSTSPIHPSSPAPASLSHSFLGLLSLRSPPQKVNSKLNDLRVKALFNPTDAARLKAVRKGQDVYVSGEGGVGVEEEDEDIMEKYGFGVGLGAAGGRGGSDWEEEPLGGADEEEGEGDDDWEEEPEGWKRTQLGMEDDDW